MNSNGSRQLLFWMLALSLSLCTGYANAASTTPDVATAQSSSVATSSTSSNVTSTTPAVAASGTAAPTKCDIHSSTTGSFIMRLYVGAEGTSVDDINNQTTTRTQLMAYNYILGTRKPESKWGYKTWGLDVFGDVILTSAVTSSSTDTTSSNSTKVGQATGGDINVYITHFLTETSDYGTFTVGPIATLEGLKPSDANQVTRSYFFGIRLANSPEQFVDLLYGKNEGISGRRVEIRAQAPLLDAKFLNGNILVGINANVAVSDKPVNNLDSVKVYAMWTVTGSDIIHIGQQK